MRGGKLGGHENWTVGLEGIRRSDPLIGGVFDFPVVIGLGLHIPFRGCCVEVAAIRERQHRMATANDLSVLDITCNEWTVEVPVVACATEIAAKAVIAMMSNGLRRGPPGGFLNYSSRSRIARTLMRRERV